MFFLKTFERPCTLHPSFLGANIRKYLWDRLLTDVEGTNTGDYYVLCVMDAADENMISEGRVIPGTGRAEFTLTYRAIIWKPFRGEVLDGVVGKCTTTGFFVNIGPLDAFVATTMIPSEYKFNPDTSPPSFTCDNEPPIEKGTHVRIKLVGVRSEVTKMYAIGTMKEDYLGTLE